MGDIATSSSSMIELRVIEPSDDEQSTTTERGGTCSNLTVSHLVHNTSSSTIGSTAGLLPSREANGSIVTFSDDMTSQHCDVPDGISNEGIPSPTRNVSPTANREKLKRLKSRLKLQDLSQNELELKAALYFHICNPLKRWRVERLVPYKLILQIVKTVFLIAQVVIFTYSSSNKQFLYLYESGILFNRLLIKGNGSSGGYIRTGYSYTQNDAIDQINYVINRYYQLPNITVGSYGHTLDTNGHIYPILVTLRQYTEANIDPSTDTFHYNLLPITSTTLVSFNDTTANNSLIDYLNTQGLEISFRRLIDLELVLKLKGVHITDRSPLECYSFTVQVRYSKDNIKSRISYHLTHQHSRISCNGNSTSSPDISAIIISLSVLDVIVIITSLLSMIFIARNYHKGYILGKAMGEFYKLQLDIQISWSERRHVFPLWHLCTLFSDIFLILGSLFKILLEYNVNVHSVTVRILLGSALIVQSAAMLRYFSFFKQFNALTRTLSAAAPELIKFLFCTSMLYFSFALCGLIVFGSYNEEMFGNFGNSVEILFALINGDSIWLVFRAFSEDDLLIYIYSRFFVYTFIFLFIYAVLNLFTSLVKSSYDNSTLVDRASLNEVRRFVFSGPLTSNGVALREVTYVHKYVNPAVILARRKRRASSTIGDLD